MSARVEEVGDRIADCATVIASLFKPGAHVTVIVRTPSHPDGSRDMVVTSDKLEDVIFALQIRARAERTPTYEAPRDLSVPVRVRGVGRDADEPRSLSVALTERPTDDDIRSLHEFLREWQP